MFNLFRRLRKAPDMPAVLLLSGLPPEQNALLLSSAPPGFQTRWLSSRAPVEEKLQAVADADFLLLWGSAVEESVVRAAPRLRLIQILDAGYEHVDLDLCATLGVPVANNGGANSWSVAELTVALMLAVLRRLVEADRSVRAGRWRGDIKGHELYELAGKTVGIIGLGHIGKKVAQRLHAFETDLTYFDPVPDEDLEAALGMRRLQLDDLLREADIVTLHVPLSPATRGLLGRRELALMQPDAVLINTCRGDVLDEEALVETLSQGRLRGAGLDVLTQEPCGPDHPLAALPIVVLPPHFGGASYDSLLRRARFVWSNVQAVWNGGEAQSVIRTDEPGLSQGPVRGIR